MSSEVSKCLAEKAMRDGKPYASGRKDQEKSNGYNSEYPEHGIYRDAVIIHGEYSTWCYHGTPIVQLNRTTGEWKKAVYGWGNARTTRDRVNFVPGRKIHTHKCRQYDHSVWHLKKRELEDEPEWKDDVLVLPQDIYHRIDAWRGYYAPMTAVAGASNTGGWSDSPCKPEEEIKRFQGILSAHGIRSTICWTETSNIFCVKNWVQVHPKYRDKAIELAKAFVEGEAHLLHLPV